jgi:hypothetical protein
MVDNFYFFLLRLISVQAAVFAHSRNLADLNHDGKLDKQEFSIACYLIKNVLIGKPLPTALPPSLLVSPLATKGKINFRVGRKKFQKKKKKIKLKIQIVGHRLQR